MNETVLWDLLKRENDLREIICDLQPNGWFGLTIEDSVWDLTLIVLEIQYHYDTGVIVGTSHFAYYY